MLARTRQMGTYHRYVVLVNEQSVHATGDKTEALRIAKEYCQRYPGRNVLIQDMDTDEIIPVTEAGRE